MASVKLEDCSQTLELNVIVKEEEEEREIEEEEEEEEGGEEEEDNDIDSDMEEEDQGERGAANPGIVIVKREEEDRDREKDDEEEEEEEGVDRTKPGEVASSDPDSLGDPDPERPYLCSQCGKRFTAASSLKIHMMTHSGEKPHQCSICGKAFLRSYDLRRHQVVHKGERNTHSLMVNYFMDYGTCTLLCKTMNLKMISSVCLLASYPDS
uniref:C2H2-type domain-containing protein n=1 Tax=Hucho hucho TaxID=62062 RepID=A0A4W5JSQ8_9TELE